MLGLVTMLLGVSGLVSAQTVPAEFQDLQSELAAGIADFRSAVARSWDGTRAPVAFSANLTSASAARGPELLADGAVDATVLELDGLKAMGVKAITLQIGFPMLYRPFHQSDDEYLRFLDFYTRVAAAIRERGLVLVVESQVLFSRGGFSYWDVGPYYDSLTLTKYREGRAIVARTIATRLRPDYLSVIMEPDTEAEQSHKPELGTVEGSRALLDLILYGLARAAVPGVAVGAGVGSWQTDYRAFVESFSATAINYVDIHIYPVNRDYLMRTLEIADIAASRGKRVGVTEAWLYKSRDSELEVNDYPMIFSRDAFSFWSALDSAFLRALVELAHAKRFAFVSPFWSEYFYSYVEYDQVTRELPAAALDQLARERQVQAIRSGTFTAPAIAYRNAIVVPPDVTPPGSPTNLTAQLTSLTGVVLTWAASPDNVGTAGYTIVRNGVSLGRTAMLHFSDEGLAEATRYVYAVIAYDLSGKASPAAVVTVSTPDVTPPSAPALVVGAARIDGNRIDIDLAWTASADNLGVTQYRIQRGTSPDALATIAGVSAAPYTLRDVQPGTRFYFAVSAIDAALNESPPTMAVVTTPPLLDRTPPTVTMTFPADGATVFGTMHLYAVAYDLRGGTWDTPSGAAAVQFQVDGVNVGPEQTESHSGTTQYAAFKLQVDTSTLSSGQHTVTAVARDWAGNVAVSAPVRVTVSPR